MGDFSADTLSKYGQQCYDVPDFPAKTFSSKRKENSSSQLRCTLTMQSKITWYLAKREQRYLEFSPATYSSIHKYCPPSLFIPVLVSAPHPISSPLFVLPTGAAELGLLPS